MRGKRTERVEAAFRRLEQACQERRSDERRVEREAKLMPNWTSQSPDGTRGFEPKVASARRAG